MFTQIKLNNGNTITAKYISLGTAFLQIQGKDGKTYVVGYNSKGELSNGTTETILYLTPMLHNDTTEVTDAILLAQTGNAEYGQYSYNTAIVRADGTVWIAGTNLYGQYGDNVNINDLYLKQMGVKGASLNVNNGYVKIGKDFDIDVEKELEFNVFVQNPINQSEWEWKSSNEDIAKIDKNTGTITGVKVGYTTITAINKVSNSKSKAIINVYRDFDGAITTPQVEIGNNFTLILKEDGTVWRNRV